MTDSQRQKVLMGLQGRWLYRIGEGDAYAGEEPQQGSLRGVPVHFRLAPFPSLALLPPFSMFFKRRACLDNHSSVSVPASS